MNIGRKYMQEQVIELFPLIWADCVLLQMQYFIINIHAHEVNQFWLKCKPLR